VLFDAGFDGEERKAIAETSKTGWTDVLDRASVLRQVRNGGGGMPPLEGTLSDREIQGVSSYVGERMAEGY
jgi:mono/diheme cytochrome c family protein